MKNHAITRRVQRIWLAWRRLEHIYGVREWNQLREEVEDMGYFLFLNILGDKGKHIINRAVSLSLSFSKYHRMLNFEGEFRQVVRLRNSAISNKQFLWLLKEILITFLHLVTWGKKKREINKYPSSKKGWTKPENGREKVKR